MKSRAPSLRRHYPASSVPLRPSDFSLAWLGFRLPLYRSIAAITRDKRDLPRYPQQLPSHPVPTTPESPSALVRLIPADGSGLPHLTTGSALSVTSYEALWVPWWYGLRVCDSSSEKVFSIHSVLRVASQNRISASGVYR
jgi:hypothetical protein